MGGKPSRRGLGPAGAARNGLEPPRADAARHRVKIAGRACAQPPLRRQGGEAYRQSKQTMKAADFLYHRAISISEAVRYLDDYGGSARVLAGGQSLVPMLNMRLWRPAALIDINAVSDLAEVQVRGDETVLGAMVRHVTIETSPIVAARLPLLSRMIRSVGDRQIRNRGT